jgi:hypothetical protein
MKKKQFYEKPLTQVIKLKLQTQLLAGSNGNGNLNSMGDSEALSREFLFDEEVDL